MQIYLNKRQFNLKKRHKKMQISSKSHITADRVRQLRRWRLIYKSMRRLEYESDRYRDIWHSFFWPS